MLGMQSWPAAADAEVIAEDENPDDAAVGKSGTGFAPLKGPWICHAKFGGESTSILFSIALSCK